MKSDETSTRLDCDWLRLFYAEAWNQYRHEDSLGQTRNHFFIVLQAGFVAFLGVMVGHLYKEHDRAVLGAIMVGTGVVFLVLSIIWIVVIGAAQKYVHVRWIVAKGIEDICRSKSGKDKDQTNAEQTINRVGLATVEHRWRHEGVRDPIGAAHRLRPPSRLGGWRASKFVASGMIAVWSIVILVGICLLLERYLKMGSIWQTTIIVAASGTLILLALLALAITCRLKQQTPFDLTEAFWWGLFSGACFAAAPFLVTWASIVDRGSFFTWLGAVAASGGWFFIFLAVYRAARPSGNTASSSSPSNDTKSLGP